MSEKRFIVFPNNVVWDNQLEEVVCRCILEGSGDAENVCQRLNEQQDTIEQLQKKLSECQGHKLELTPIPISRPITLKEAEDSIRITKYEELFDDE